MTTTYRTWKCLRRSCMHVIGQHYGTWGKCLTDGCKCVKFVK